MADEQNNTASNESKKAKTVAENMTGYRTFPSPEEAGAYLAKCAEDYSDFADQTFAMLGVSDEGFDPEIYTDNMAVRVAVLKNRAEKKGEPSTVKAIVVGPVPTLDSVLADPSAKAWLQKILDKESNHVLVRPLRDADNVADKISEMPKTLPDFYTSGREAGGIMESFDQLYRSINNTLAEKVKSWAKAKRQLIKSELRKAMESAAYALEYFPALEDRGEGKDSLFVTAIKLGQAAAKAKGLDPAIFDKWLETRDQQTLTVTDEDEDESDLDLDVDALAESMTSDESEKEGETAQTDGETENA